ncbi:MAG TPA: dihydrodipicolinate synthase family protein [Orrella sp.]
MRADASELDASAKGVYLITVTPFMPDGALDVGSIDRLVDFYLDAGANGLTLLGVLGEAPKLTALEATEYVKRVLARVNGAVPVVVGASAAGFAAMGELTKRVMDIGANGVMVAPAAGLRTDDQIRAYFAMVNETLGADVPWVLQDHPNATGVQMSGALVMQIIDQSPQCVMLKHEDSPGLNKLSAIRAAQAQQTLKPVSILSGNGGGLFLPEELERGADGAMTGFAYPEMMVQVCNAHAAGDVDRAFDVFDAYLPLSRYEQQAGIGLAVRKYLLAKRGAIASDTLRKPGPVLSKQDVIDIERLIKRQEKRLTELG